MMRVCGILLVLLTFLLAPFSQGQTPPSDAITAALRVRDFDRAVELSRSALLKLRPAHPTAHAMLAVLEFRQRNCTEAVSHFEAAGPLLDSQPDAQNAYGTCLVRLRRFEMATNVFGRALALNPENPRQRQLVAAIQLMAHKPQEAIATLQPLIASGRADAQALELASSAYEEAGDTPEAVSALRQAIILDPHNPNPYIDFANLSMNHQSFQVGINVVSDGISVQPKTASLYLARGVLYVQLADYDKAEADFETAHQ